MAGICIPDKNTGLLYYGLTRRFVNGLLAHAQRELEPSLARWGEGIRLELQLVFH
jgi:hypothetical protein